MQVPKTLQIFLALLMIASTTMACNQFVATPTFADETTTVPAATIEPVQPRDPQAGSPGLNDSLYPDFGNGGYDVSHYTLDITVNDVSTSDLTAVTIVEAKATQDLNSFNLDFIGFQIR